MTTHPNDVPDGRLTADEHEAMIANNIERLLERRDDRLRQAEWPLVVNDLIRWLVSRVQSLESEVAALRVPRG